MRKLLLFAAMVGASAQEAPINVVGEFSNIRYTSEHEYGYSVQLWRRGDEMFGFFLAAAGLQGDTPIGLLDEVQYDPRTGKLAFRSKLTTGIVRRNGKDEPARDLFDFDGRLRGDLLTGVLKHSEAGVETSAEKIRLVRARQQPLSRPAGFAVWQKDAAEMLSRRGPKW